MKYKFLTSEQRATLEERGILNGCGPQSWHGWGPNWLFKADCYEHDYNYAVGGSEADRRMADWGFYIAMIQDTKRLVWFRQPFARLNAWIFYQAVRMFGKKHYNYQGPTNIL